MNSNAKGLRSKLLLLFIPLLLITCWFLDEMSSGSTGGGGGYDLTELYFAFSLAGYTLFYMLVMFSWLLFLAYQKKNTSIHVKCLLWGSLATMASFVYLAIVLGL